MVGWRMLKSFRVIRIFGEKEPDDLILMKEPPPVLLLLLLLGYERWFLLLDGGEPLWLFGTGGGPAHGALPRASPKRKKESKVHDSFSVHQAGNPGRAGRCVSSRERLWCYGLFQSEKLAS